MSSKSAAGLLRMLMLAGGLVAASPAIAGEPKPLAEPSGEARAPADEAVRPVQARPPGCGRWSDGCVTCTAPGDGAPVCSNVGIACTPKEIRCTAADLPQKSEPEPNNR